MSAIHIPQSALFELESMKAADSKPAPDLMRIIHPQAQDRWSGLTTHDLSPDRVRQILTGAATGNLLSQQQLFDLMVDTSPRLNKNLNRVKNAVTKSDKMVMPYAEGKAKPSSLAQDKADFLEQVIYDFRPNVATEEANFEDGLYDMLAAFDQGLSVQEILWERRADGDLAGAIVPRAFNWIPANYYGWDGLTTDLKLSPDGMLASWIPFPENQFIVARFRTKTGHSSTTAMLRALAPLWVGANFGYDWLLNFAQLFGVPIRWATYDRNTTTENLNKICDMLANMGSAAWGAFPAGTTMELKEAVQRAADNPQKLLMDVFDLACDIRILGQTLTTDVGASGSRALGDVHQGVEAEVIDHCAGWACEVLNYQFIPALMRLNFGNNDEDPYFEAKSVRPKDDKAMVERDKILFVDMKLPVEVDYIYERYGIPRPDDDAELFEAPEAPVAPGANAKTQMPNDKRKEQKLKAKSTDLGQLGMSVAEELTGVQRRWLKPVANVFDDLVAKAQDGTVTDAELLQALEHAADRMPELFPDLQASSVELRKLLEDGMAAALLNGAQQAPVAKRGAS